jgi:hypothetical protein
MWRIELPRGGCLAPGDPLVGSGVAGLGGAGYSFTSIGADGVRFQHARGVANGFYIITADRIGVNARGSE